MAEARIEWEGSGSGTSGILTLIKPRGNTGLSEGEYTLTAGSLLSNSSPVQTPGNNVPDPLPREFPKIPKRSGNFRMSAI